MYLVRLRSRRVERELDDLPESVYKRIIEVLLALGDNPRPGSSVKITDDIYRIRIGRYRLIYHVDDTARTIDVGGVKMRTEATYRHLRDLFR